MHAIHDYPAHPLYERSARSKVRLYWGRRALGTVALAASDLLSLGGALLLALELHHLMLGAADWPIWSFFVLAAWLCGSAFARLLPGWGLATPVILGRVTGVLLAVYAISAAALVLAHQLNQDTLFLLVFSLILSWPLVLAFRWAARQLLLGAGLWGVPTLVFGQAQVAAPIAAALREQPGYGYLPAGTLDEQTLRMGGLQSGVFGEASVAVVATGGLDRSRLTELLDGPLALFPKVIVVSDLPGMESMWVSGGDYGGWLGVEMARKLLDPLSALAKRTFDLLAVLLTAPVWVPVCALLALLIWMGDRANPLFLQRRVGKDGRPFMTWKFRTMLPNAEEVLRRKLEQDPALRAEWETHYKLKRDPRITPVGGLLRKTSLDEIPQLVNVLLGEMSLVGPRPLPAYHQEQLSPQTQQLRARVRPGLTGLWQVSGRSDAGNAGMERWDPYYVRNWSIWLDLSIVLRTVVVVLKGSGAY